MCTLWNAFLTKPQGPIFSGNTDSHISTIMLSVLLVFSFNFHNSFNISNIMIILLQMGNRLRQSLYLGNGHTTRRCQPSYPETCCTAYTPSAPFPSLLSLLAFFNPLFYVEGRCHVSWLRKIMVNCKHLGSFILRNIFKP